MRIEKIQRGRDIPNPLSPFSLGKPDQSPHLSFLVQRSELWFPLAGFYRDIESSITPEPNPDKPKDTRTDDILHYRVEISLFPLMFHSPTHACSTILLTTTNAVFQSEGNHNVLQAGTVTKSGHIRGENADEGPRALGKLCGWKGLYDTINKKLATWVLTG